MLVGLLSDRRRRLQPITMSVISPWSVTRNLPVAMSLIRECFYLLRLVSSYVNAILYLGEVKSNMVPEWNGSIQFVQLVGTWKTRHHSRP